MYTDNSDNVASIRINSETLQLIAVVIGIFLLALLCLACSLHPGSVCSCCASLQRRRRNNRSSDDASHAYDTLNDFIFGQNSTTNQNTAHDNGDDSEMPTSLEQVFPDLLEEGSGAAAWESERANRRSSGNNDLNEPLL